MILMVPILMKMTDRLFIPERKANATLDCDSPRISSPLPVYSVPGIQAAPTRNATNLSIADLSHRCLKKMRHSP